VTDQPGTGVVVTGQHRPDDPQHDLQAEEREQ